MMKEMLCLISMILLGLFAIILTFIGFNYSVLSGILVFIISSFVVTAYIWACMIIFDGGNE